MIKSKTITVFELDNGHHIKHHYVSLYQEFDPHGLLIQETVFNPAGEMDGKTLFTYNAQGFLIEQLNFDKEDQLVERIDHFFDEKGSLMQTEILCPDGCKKIKEYHFDPVEKIEKAVLNSEQGEIEGYEICWYSQKNEVIAEVKSDNNNRITFKRFATYDGAGRLVIEEIFGCDEKFERKRTYAYHPHGKLSKITTQDKKGNKILLDLFMYDDQERLVEKITMDQVKGHEIHNRFSYDLSGNQILDETFDHNRLVFRHCFKYDEGNQVVEEEIISFGRISFRTIRKHDIEYW